MYTVQKPGKPHNYWIFVGRNIYSQFLNNSYPHIVHNGGSVPIYCGQLCLQGLDNLWINGGRKIRKIRFVDKTTKINTKILSYSRNFQDRFFQWTSVFLTHIHISTPPTTTTAEFHH